MEDKTKEEKPKESPLNEAAKEYLNNLDALRETFPLVRVMLSAAKLSSDAKLEKFISKNGVKIKESDDSAVYSLETKFHRHARNLEKKKENWDTGAELLPRHFLVASVSAYDSFLGNLIKAIYTLKPEMLHASEKIFSFSELVKFETIDAAREKILENEIDSILRKSHAEQIQILQAKFNIKINPEDNLWKDFIELTERRNIFVHADGKVSSQYLLVCKQHNVIIDESCKIDTKLSVTNNYLLKANDTLFEMGVKILQVLWRHLFPEEIELADDNLIHTTYSLIIEERIHLAIALLDFACSTLKKWSNDSSKRILIINRALAYKNNDDVIKSKELIKSHDWSSCDDRYKLSLAALNDDYEEIVIIMRRNKHTGLMQDIDYLEWPILESFRETDLFRTSFIDVFGVEPYVSRLESDPIPDKEVHIPQKEIGTERKKKIKKKAKPKAKEKEKEKEKSA